MFERTPSIKVLKTATLGGHNEPVATPFAGDADQGNSISGVADPDDRIEEARLMQEIKSLWTSHQTNSGWVRIYRRGLESNRHGLGECLAAYKQLLARTGRDGRWADFLRKMDIPRTSADRYIDKWQISIAPNPGKRTAGAIDQPSKEDITDLVKRVKSKAQRVLTTDESVAQFLIEIAAALRPPVPAA